MTLIEVLKSCDDKNKNPNGLTVCALDRIWTLTGNASRFYLVRMGASRVAEHAGNLQPIGWQGNRFLYHDLFVEYCKHPQNSKRGKELRKRIDEIERGHG